MSSQLLAECVEQFGLHGFDPAFRSYFMQRKSQLFASDDVACGLVVLAAQENDSAGHASRLLGLLLDEARMGLENDGAYAGNFLETVELTLQSGISAGAIRQEKLMEFAGLYRRADLPVPQSFTLDPDNMASLPDMEDFDPPEYLEKLARDIMEGGGTAYDLFNAIESMLAAVPEKAQAGLANLIATMHGPFFERCALFMLSSGSELVQQATVAGLSERLDDAGSSVQLTTLLPMIRGWFAAGPTQAGLDKLIKKTRRMANPEQACGLPPQFQEVVASITDGVGAQSIAVVLKQGSNTVLAMILLKAGHGVKDGFLVPIETKDDADHVVAQLRAETGADNISTDTLRVLLEGALADGLKNGCLPAPGFLDVVEACNLFDLRPQELDLDALLDLADPERKIQDASAQALGRWINDDIALYRLDSLTESWFEDTEDTRGIVAAGRTARSIETKLRKYLETRRETWARRFLQTAVMLRDGDRLREWKNLTASAYGLMNGRALKRIPLMEDIMYMTIEADDLRMWG